MIYLYSKFNLLLNVIGFDSHSGKIWLSVFNSIDLLVSQFPNELEFPTMQIFSP